MTVGELKEMLESVPDDFVIGKTKTEKIFENFNREYTKTYIQDVNVHPVVDLKEKKLLLTLETIY